MERTSTMPLWVFLGLMNIETRKGAIILTSCSLLFALGFIPLPLFLEDWSWRDVAEYSGMMTAITLWYWLSMRWVDKNNGWSQTDVPS